MWSITPDVVELAREELKGRRAAIQARYNDEIQKLVAELDDIEALERIAAAFAQRHQQEEVSASVEPNPMASLETLPIAANLAADAEETGPLEAQPEDHPEIEILPGAETLPVALEASEAQKVSSRWRVRV